MNYSHGKTFKTPIIVAFSSLALAVMIGAFGAHIVESRISQHYMAIYKTGSLYHFVHSLGWLIVILVCMHFEIKNMRWINTLFLLGLILFSGSLYILSFNEFLEMPGLRKLGAITPIGGVCFIGAWLVSAYSVFKEVN